MFSRLNPAQAFVLVLSVGVLIFGIYVGYRIGFDTEDAEPEEQVEYTLTAAASVPLTVHVVGAVQRPGLYTLAAGARVRDAVLAAGGFRTDADSASVNLAAFVDDGQQVCVEAKEAPQPEPTPQPAAAAAPAQTVAPTHAPARAQPVMRASAPPTARPRTTTPTPNAKPSSDVPDFMSAPSRGRVPLNRAGLEELQTIPGIGPELAKNIIYYRSANGPFRRFSDLDNVPGIGPATIEKIRVSAKLN